MSYEIKVYRLSNNHSQAEMAEKLGISTSQVSMVENGKRALSHEAQQIFIRLHKDDTINITIEDFSTINDSFQKVIVEHAKELETSISIRIGDLQSELHKNIKKITKWKNQVDAAIGKLYYIHAMDAQFPDGEMPDHTRKKLIGERYRAEATIQTILNLKPELTASKIISIQAELDYLIQGKGKIKNRLGFDVKNWVAGLPNYLPAPKAIT